jgi:hypothetical protein
MRGVFSVGLPVAALLGIGVASFAQVALNAPAFSPSLRAESVLGDWREAGTDALYAKSEYYFQLGYGYLHSDTATLLLGDEELSDADVFAAQMERSVALIRESLAYSPGQASAWTSLSWASMLSGDPARAAEALRASWELAPHNLGEAGERLALVALLQGSPDFGWQLEAADEESHARDLEVLAAHDPVYLEVLEGGLGSVFD